jgi:F-type H+-transporting ATPase subunit delta
VEDTRIARVYAGALFEAAAEADAVEPVRKDLRAFVEALEASPELRAFFYLDENLTLPDKSRIVLQLTEGGDPRFRNFLRVLVDKSREPIVEEVDRLYNALVERAAGVVKVELTTALALSEAVKKELGQHFESSLGKSVEPTFLVDESIIGGVKLRVGDRIADASVRHKFDQLRMRLEKSTAMVEVSVEASS